MEDKDRFAGERAAEYDRWIPDTIPGYAALHEMAVSLIRTGLASSSSSAARLLVTGSGTGMEISTLARANSGWTFTGVDPSPDMTAVATRRMAESNLSERVDFHTGYVHELPREETYDAATLLLVMHFLPDDGAKLDLLRSIANRLSPGAPFILADLHADRESPKFSRFLAAWRDRMKAKGMSGEDLEKMFDDLQTHIHFVPEKRIQTLLKTAGFGDTERFFNAMLFGGWVSRKV